MLPSARGFKRALERQIGDLKQRVQVEADIDAASARMRRSFAQAGDDSGRSFASRFSASAGSGVSGTFERVLGAGLARTAIKLGAFASTAGLAGGAVAALTAGFVQLTAAVGPAVAAGAALPAAYLAVAQATGIARIGLLHMDKALEGDAEALAKLHPEARKVADVLRGPVAKSFDAVRKSIQGQLFENLAQPIQRLAGTYLPILRAEGNQTAGALNALARQAIAMAQAPAFRRDFATIMAGNTETIVHLGQAGLSLGNVLRNLLVVVQPLTQRFAVFVERSAAQLDRLVASGRRTGDLQAFFKRAGDTAGQLGRIIANVSVGLFRFFQAGTAGGRGLLDTLEQATARFRAFTDTAAAQARFTRFFQTGNENLRAFGRLLADAGRLFGDAFGGASLAPVIDQIRTQLLPAVAQLLRSFQQADVLPKLISAVSDFVTVAAQSGGVVAAFANSLAGIAAATRTITETVPGASQALGVLAVVVGVNLAAKVVGLGGAFSVLSGAILGAGRAAAGAVGSFIALQAANFAAGFTSSAAAVSPFTGVMGTLGGQVRFVASVMGALVANMARMVAARVAAAAMTALSFAVRAVATAMLFLAANPIVLIIAGIAALIAAGVLLFRHNQQFRALVLAVWNGIRAAVGAVVAWFTGTVVPSLQAAYQQLLTGLRVMAAAFSAVWNGLRAVVTVAFNAIRSVVLAGMGVLASVWRSLWGTFGPVVVATWNFIKAVIQLAWVVIKGVTLAALIGIRAAATAAWNAIRAATSAAWNAIRAVITAVVGFLRPYVTSAWNAIRSASVSAWNAIRAAVSAAVNAVRSVVVAGFSAVRAAVVAAWNAVRSATASAWSSIRSVVSSAASSIRSVVSSAFNAARSIAVSAFNSIRSAVSSAMSSAVSAVSSGASRIRGVFAGAGSWLVNAGREIVNGLVRGITSRINAATSAVQSLTSRLRSFLPGSPVREGPLRVLNRGYAGKQIVRMLASGITDNARILDSASERMAERLLLPFPAVTAASLAGAASGAVSTAAAVPRSTSVRLVNQGVIGSQMELENWLTGALDSVTRKGRA